MHVTRGPRVQRAAELGTGAPLGRSGGRRGPGNAGKQWWSQGPVHKQNSFRPNWTPAQVPLPGRSPSPSCYRFPTTFWGDQSSASVGPGSHPRPAGSPQPMTNMGVKMPDADRRRGNSGMAAIQLARLHPGRPLPGLSPPLLSSTYTGSFSFGSNRGHGLSHVRLVSVTTTVCTLSLSPSIKEEKRENLVLHGRKARCSLS